MASLCNGCRHVVLRLQGDQRGKTSVYSCQRGTCLLLSVLAPRHQMPRYRHIKMVAWVIFRPFSHTCVKRFAMNVPKSWERSVSVIGRTEGPRCSLLARWALLKVSKHLSPFREVPINGLCSRSHAVGSAAEPGSECGFH